MGEAEKQEDESLMKETRRVNKDRREDKKNRKRDSKQKWKLGQQKKCTRKSKNEKKKTLIRTNMYRTVRTHLSSARDQIYSHEWISIGAVESHSFLGAVIWSCPSPYFSVCAPGEHN